MACAILAPLLLLPSLVRSYPDDPDSSQGWERISPRLVLGGVPLQFVFAPPDGSTPDSDLKVLIQEGEKDLQSLSLVQTDAETGRGFTTHEFQLTGWGHRKAVITAHDGSRVATIHFTLWPGLLTLLPPFIAITMALITRQVLISLLLGIWVGAVFIAGPNIFSGTLRSIDTTIVGSISNADHVKVLLFTLFLGGMVGVMSRSGGTLGIVKRLATRATTPKRGALSAWFLGLFIFFDDYANTIIIGPTLRPITDRLKLSREKLAYLVDATAAPVASIALISTWIGTEVGLIGDALADVGSEMDAYKVFLETLPYRFYPILALVLGFLVAATGRDWGPMHKAEIRARGGQVLRPGAQPLADFESDALRPKQNIPNRPINAFLPILAVVVATLTGLWFTGAPSAGSPSLGDLFSHPQPLRLLGDIFGAADSYSALLWASALGGILALSLAWGQRILGLGEGISAWVGGVRGMLLAAIILILAWSLGDICREIGTSPYLVGLLAEHLNPHFLPLIIFVVAALVSFATGTSWGTMAILIPVTVPLAVETCLFHGFGPDPSHRILLGSLSSILAGAVFGDHCSPISDTTVLSSLATSCDHVDHVRTQLPYALVVGFVGMVVGDLPSAFGMSPWWSILLGTLVLIGVVMILGRKVPAEIPDR